MKSKLLFIPLFFMALCVVIVMAGVVYDAVFYPVKYKNEITMASNEFGVEKSLICSVIKKESNFNINALSSSGAMGLMQIMPNTARWIAKELNEEYVEDNLYKSQTNIRYGTFYLKYLFDKFNNLDTVLACYNAGEGRVINWLNEENQLDINLVSYKETANYINKVENYLKIYKNKI